MALAITVPNLSRALQPYNALIARPSTSTVKRSRRRPSSNSFAEHRENLAHCSNVRPLSDNAATMPTPLRPALWRFGSGGLRGVVGRAFGYSSVIGVWFTRPKSA